MARYSCICGFATDTSYSWSAHMVDNFDDPAHTATKVPLIKNCHEVIPANFDKTGMCDSRSYRVFESRLISYLRNNRWQVDGFVTIEGDSFGPMIRVAKAVDPNGVDVDILHG